MNKSIDSIHPIPIHPIQFPIHTPHTHITGPQPRLALVLHPRRLHSGLRRHPALRLPSPGDQRAPHHAESSGHLHVPTLGLQDPLRLLLRRLPPRTPPQTVHGRGDSAFDRRLPRPGRPPPPLGARARPGAVLRHRRARHGRYHGRRAGGGGQCGVWDPVVHICNFIGSYTTT